jgi:hypothetical protein
MSSNQGSQITMQEPWKKAAPHLTGIMTDAEKLYDQGAGFNPFPGQGYVDMSGQTKGALGGMWNTAQKEGLGQNAAQTLNQMMAAPGGGLTTRDDYQRMLGSAPTSFGDDYARMFNSAGSEFSDDYARLGQMNPNAITQNLRGIAAEGGLNPNQYDRLGNLNPSAVTQNLRGVAGGDHTLGTMTNLEKLYGATGRRGADEIGDLENLRARSSNEGFGRVIDEQVGKTADDVNRQFSMSGRYGSGAHTGVLTEELGNLRDRMASNNWQQNVANERGLLGDISGVGSQTLGQQQGLLGDIRGLRQSDLSNRMGAVGMLGDEQQQRFGNEMGIVGAKTGLQQQNIANRLGASGMLSGEQQQQLANQMGITGARAGLEQQGWQNQMGALGAQAGQEQLGFENQRGLLGDITNVEQQGIGNRFGALDRVGQAQDDLYDRFGRMGTVGSAYDDLATRQLQSQMDQWNQSQQEPWSRLGAYSGMVGGSNPAGMGTSTSTATMPSNPWGGALGGALGGAQMGAGFGMPWLGGLLGGGLGFLGGL